MKPKTRDYYELIKHISEGYALHKMIFDEKGNPVDYEFIEVNDAFTQITGKKREEIEGKTALEILSWLKKDGVKSSAFARYGKISKEGGVVKLVNNYFVAYDKWMNVTAFSTGDGYFTTLAQDRTAEKLLKSTNQYTEERYRSILETVPVAIVEADITQVMNSVNALRGETEDICEFLRQRPEFVNQTREIFSIKSLNNEAVRLFKAKSQQDLMERVPQLLREVSDREWIRFINGIWTEKAIIELEISLKDFSSEELMLFIQAKVIHLKEESRLLISMLNVTHIKQMEVEWEKQQIELQASYEQMEAYSGELRETQSDLYLTNKKLAQTNEILINREKQLKMALQSAREALWILEEKSGKLENIGDWKGLLGYEPDELSDDLNQWLCLVHEEDKDRLRLKLQGAFEKNEGFFEVEYRIRNKEGKWLWALSRGEVMTSQEGGGKMILGTHQDITQRKEIEQRLDYISFYDVLTALPNRYYLMQKLDEELERAKRNRNIMAIVSLDLDGFKKINESMGSSLGDELLTMIAARLRAHIRKQDFVARASSDEFTMIFSDLKNKEDITSLVRNILKRFDKPFKIDEKEVFVSFSMGISVFPDNGDEISELYKKADLALMGAKKAGKNTFRFYTAKMNTKALKRLEMETKMHKAIEKNEFTLYYQPQFDLTTNSLVGVEALLRWEDSKTCFIPPVEFIPIAEESGLIIPLGTWVMKNACLQRKRWSDMGLNDFRVSINISPLQFAQENFLDILKQTMDETGINPHELMLEITEGILMDDIEDTIKKLDKIKKLGCKLSIDDFGTGYSSLAYLRKFPIDELKIDKSFVLDLSYPDNASIVKTIISLAKNLNLDVIAEGIEDTVQKDFLLENKCNKMQGFLFGHPESKEKIEEFLKELMGGKL